jgi:hypothetical protein
VPIRDEDRSFVLYSVLVRPRAQTHEELATWQSKARKLAHQDLPDDCLLSDAQRNRRVDVLELYHFIRLINQAILRAVGVEPPSYNGESATVLRVTPDTVSGILQALGY